MVVITTIVTTTIVITTIVTTTIVITAVVITAVVITTVVITMVVITAVVITAVVITMVVITMVAKSYVSLFFAILQQTSIFFYVQQPHYFIKSQLACESDVPTYVFIVSFLYFFYFDLKISTIVWSIVY